MQKFCSAATEETIRVTRPRRKPALFQKAPGVDKGQRHRLCVSFPSRQEGATVTSPSVQMEFTDMCAWASNPKSSVKSKVTGQNGVKNRLRSQHRPLRLLFASRLRQQIGLRLPACSWIQGKAGFLGGKGWCRVSGR